MADGVESVLSAASVWQGVLVILSEAKEPKRGSASFASLRMTGGLMRPMNGVTQIEPYWYYCFGRFSVLAWAVAINV